ncbi:protein PYRICULARIA ORYZAE RESISTANCE 21-like [Magnolia sinica]|uniref:protein PYRICULARIA ORYZAE RESISTANCE 21-like n=1 Tax=Magnolia sinica TaxID=86752 RepID=UPI002659D521|nr:protein PYRICULARIA ORYZAE RESISTANCE 21-like [Magnolia sinica]
MADETSTLVLNVDLDYHPCKTKMRKVLRKFLEIKSQIFYEEQKKVIISGPFDPEKLIKKLYCKVGCKIITGYEILEPAKSKDKQTVPSSTTTKPPNEQPPSKPEPLVPGPVNIVIGPIGPVCYCRPFQLPDCPILMDCYCSVKNPTCHCNGS